MRTIYTSHLHDVYDIQLSIEGHFRYLTKTTFLFDCSTSQKVYTP
jgi:hypothetical protein